MKKIKNVRHLRKEKERLQQQQQSLEAAIRNDWNAVKEAVQNGTLLKESLSEWMNRKTVAAIAGNDIIRSSLLFGATMLAGRLLIKTTGKLKSLFT